MAVRGALTPRETRLIEYLHTQDVFFRFGDWPRYIRDIMLKPHKNNRERYTLFFFFVANGLEPATAAEWTLLIDYRRPAGGGAPREIRGGYDLSAQQHMIQMIRQVEQETFFRGNKAMMDMTLGRVVMM